MIKRFFEVIPLTDSPAVFPPVPLTLEGSSLLHQFFRFDWKAWRATPVADRERIAADAVAALKGMERASADGPVRSAVFSQLGHKGDLILMHFRESFEALNQVELDLAQTEFYGYLSPVHSYVSVVELGLYESSRKTYEAAAAKGFEQHSADQTIEVTARHQPEFRLARHSVSLRQGASRWANHSLCRQA